MGDTTSRDDLPYPVPSDPNNVPSDMEALADRLDSIVGAESSGAESALPAPSTADAGFKYFATNEPNLAGSEGVLYWDNGTAQVPLNPALTVGGAATPSAVGDTEENGSSGVIADAAHRHARETFAGTGGTYGESNDPARADHSHIGTAKARMGVTNPGLMLAAGSSSFTIEDLTVYYDPGDNCNGANGTFTVPAAGFYLVVGLADFNASGGTANGTCTLTLTVNGNNLRSYTLPNNINEISNGGPFLDTFNTGDVIGMSVSCTDTDGGTTVTNVHLSVSSQESP